MTATAVHGWELGAGGRAPHRHVWDRFRVHHDAVWQARHRRRLEHRREMRDLHEQDLQHDPRNMRAHFTIEYGGVRPFFTY